VAEGTLVLVLGVQDEGDRYGTGSERLVLTASPAYMDGAHVLRSPSDSEYDEVQCALANLVVRAQNDSSHAREGGRAYSADVAYLQPYTVSARRARIMVATLGRIERKLAKLAEKYGRPGTFATYLLQVADALAIDSFVVESKEMLATGLFVRIMTGENAQFWLDDREAEFIRRHQDAARPMREVS
jgi:hypothetical protein